MIESKRRFTTSQRFLRQTHHLMRNVLLELKVLSILATFNNLSDKDIKIINNKSWTMIIHRMIEMELTKQRYLFHKFKR